MRISKIKKLLYRSLDEDLSEKDKKKLENALSQNHELRKEKAWALKQRRLIAESGSENFEAGFTRRVIAKIAEISPEKDRNQLEPAYELMKDWFQRLAAVGALVLFILIALNLTMKNLTPENEIFYASAAAYEEIQNLPLF